MIDRKAFRPYGWLPLCSMAIPIRGICSVVPSEDQHASEYLADCDARRAYISGFTGSAGLAVITISKANLFTDGRYFLQASKQLDDNWVLQKQGLKDVPTWQEYIEKVSIQAMRNVPFPRDLICCNSARRFWKQNWCRSYLIIRKSVYKTNFWGHSV